MLCYHSACRHADTYADVPRGEIGACGCGALVVGGKVDVERVHCGEHNAEAHAEHQRDEEEGCRGHVRVVGCYESAEAEENEGYDDGIVSEVDALGDISVVDLFPAMILDTPMPAAIMVKKKPVATSMPISRAYMATKFVVAP